MVRDATDLVALVEWTDKILSEQRQAGRLFEGRS